MRHISLERALLKLCLFVGLLQPLYEKESPGQGAQQVQTIPEDFEEDLDGEMEEDEERAVEDALLEAEFHENVVAVTENT